MKSRLSAQPSMRTSSAIRWRSWTDSQALHKRETAGPTRVPMNQLLRLRSYPAADDHSVPPPTPIRSNVCLARCVGGANGSDYPGHGRSLLHDANAERVDECLPKSRDENHRPKAARLCHHRPQVVRCASRRRTPNTNRQPRLSGSRPHLLHWDTTGLRKGSHVAGSNFLGPVRSVRQAVFAAAVSHRCWRRYEDAAGEPGERAKRQRLF